jgi:ribonuclease HI
VTAIQNIPKPTTEKQMMSFLGMTSYCRTFISGYTDKVLNHATLLPIEGEGEPHCCISVLEEICNPRVDLQSETLVNSDLILFVDGSSSRDEFGKNRAGYAVVSSNDILAQDALPPSFSVQGPELVALTTACTLAEDKRVTIYTDSRYAFGVVHDFGALWKHRKFMKADGELILNHSLVKDLLDALLLPSAIAVCKCQAHTTCKDDVSEGDRRGDFLFLRHVWLSWLSAQKAWVQFRLCNNSAQT